MEGGEPSIDVDAAHEVVQKLWYQVVPSSHRKIHNTFRRSAYLIAIPMRLMALAENLSENAKAKSAICSAHVEQLEADSRR